VSLADSLSPSLLPQDQQQQQQRQQEPLLLLTATPSPGQPPEVLQHICMPDSVKHKLTRLG
jgi:hypothetical protein